MRCVKSAKRFGPLPASAQLEGGVLSGGWPAGRRRLVRVAPLGGPVPHRRWRRPAGVGPRLSTGGARPRPPPLLVGDQLLHTIVAAMTRHLARLTGGTVFLPRERLDQLYGVSGMAIILRQLLPVRCRILATKTLLLVVRRPRVPRRRCGKTDVFSRPRPESHFLRLKVVTPNPPTTKRPLALPKAIPAGRRTLYKATPAS